MSKLEVIPTDEVIGTYKCSQCQDTGFIADKDINKGGRIYSSVIWCVCERGEHAQTGHWLERIYPRSERSERRVFSKLGEAEFESFLHRYPERAERARLLLRLARERMISESKRKQAIQKLQED